MKRRLISTTILLLITAVIIFGIITPSFAQGDKKREFYYYFEGKKKYLDVSYEWIGVEFVEWETALDGKLTVIRNVPNLGDLSLMRTLHPSSKINLVPLEKGMDLKQVLETVQSVRDLPEIKWANPVVTFRDGKKDYYCTYTDVFAVAFLETISSDEIERINRDFDIEVYWKNTSLRNNWMYRILPTSQYDALQLAALYYETGKAVFTDPLIECPPIRFTSMNDTFRAVQWDLDPNPGIDVVNAHNITTGSGSVIIAVLDDAGFDLGHNVIVATTAVGTALEASAPYPHRRASPPVPLSILNGEGVSCWRDCPYARKSRLRLVPLSAWRGVRPPIGVENSASQSVGDNHGRPALTKNSRTYPDKLDTNIYWRYAIGKARQSG